MSISHLAMTGQIMVRPGLPLSGITPLPSLPAELSVSHRPSLVVHRQMIRVIATPRLTS
jgi:hypothetical protein